MLYRVNLIYLIQLVKKISIESIDLNKLQCIINNKIVFAKAKIFFTRWKSDIDLCSLLSQKFIDDT